MHWALLIVGIALTLFGQAQLAPLLMVGAVAISADDPGIYGAGAYPDRTGIFIPEIWSGKLLEKFYASTVFGMIANTDYEGEVKQKGDTIHIRQRPDVTISDYEKGDTITYEDLVSILVDMTVDYAKLFAFKVDRIDEKQSDVKLMDIWASDASEQMKIAIDRVVLGGVYTGTHAKNAGAAAGLGSGNINLGTEAAPLAIDKTNVLDLIVDLGTVLDEQNVPETGRWIVLPPAVCGKIKKSDLKDASLAGDGTSMLRNGRLGIIDRFTLFTSNNLTKVTDGGTAKVSWQALAGTNHAISFASQITELDYLPKLEQTFGSAMRGLNVFGFKVVKPEALALARIEV
jgi:N4-gp56 family major capsid protein